MNLSEQVAVGKQARIEYITLLRKIMEQEADVEKAWEIAKRAGDDRAIKDAVEIEKAWYHQINSAEWYFHEDIRCLKPE